MVTLSFFQIRPINKAGALELRQRYLFLNLYVKKRRCL
jgi:hypothetical protein